VKSNPDLFIRGQEYPKKVHPFFEKFQIKLTRKYLAML